MSKVNSTSCMSVNDKNVDGLDAHMNSDPSRFRVMKWIVRTRKQDSAFLYAILEAQEGLTAYSTLLEQREVGYRDVELVFTPEHQAELRDLLSAIGPIVAILSE